MDDPSTEVEVYMYVNGYYDGMKGLPPQTNDSYYVHGHEDGFGDHQIGETLAIYRGAIKFAMTDGIVIMAVQKYDAADEADCLYLEDMYPEIEYEGGYITKFIRMIQKDEDGNICGDWQKIVV